MERQECLTLSGKARKRQTSAESYRDERNSILRGHSCALVASNAVSSGKRVAEAKVAKTGTTILRDPQLEETGRVWTPESIPARGDALAIPAIALAG
jgi:hypothetical protein